MVILVNWNGWKDTINCASSVMASNFLNIKILIVDNGSTDGSIEQIIDWANQKNVVLSVVHLQTEDIRTSRHNLDARIYLLLSGKNFGFASGCNAAIRYAADNLHSNYFFFLNNDAIVNQETIGRLVESAARIDGLGALGAMIYDYDDRSRLQAYGGGYVIPFLGYSWLIRGQRKSNRIKSTFVADAYISGACMMIPAATIDRIGLMDEGYFLYWEDADWCKRMTKADLTLVIDNRAKVFHKHGGSGRGIRPFILRCQTRSSIRYAKKYYPNAWWIYLFPIVILRAARILKTADVHLLKSVIGGAVSAIRGTRISPIVK